MAAPVQRLCSRFTNVLNKTSWGASTISSTKYSSKQRTYFTYSPEIAQPLQREPKWTTAEEAVKCIKSGNLRQIPIGYANLMLRNRNACPRLILYFVFISIVHQNKSVLKLVVSVF